MNEDLPRAICGPVEEAESIAVNVDCRFSTGTGHAFYRYRPCQMLKTWESTIFPLGLFGEGLISSPEMGREVGRGQKAVADVVDALQLPTPRVQERHHSRVNGDVCSQSRR